MRHSMANRSLPVCTGHSAALVQHKDNFPVSVPVAVSNPGTPSAPGTPSLMHVLRKVCCVHGCSTCLHYITSKQPCIRKRPMPCGAHPVAHVVAIYVCGVCVQVLVQEVQRVNALLTVVRSSLTDLGKSVRGLALMSGDLDSVGRALFAGKVPQMWLKKSFPSLKVTCNAWSRVFAMLLMLVLLGDMAGGTTIQRLY